MSLWKVIVLACNASMQCHESGTFLPEPRVHPTLEACMHAAEHPMGNMSLLTIRGYEDTKFVCVRSYEPDPLDRYQEKIHVLPEVMLGENTTPYIPLGTRPIGWKRKSLHAPTWGPRR